MTSPEHRNASSEAGETEESLAAQITEMSGMFGSAPPLRDSTQAEERLQQRFQRLIELVTEERHILREEKEAMEARFDERIAMERKKLRREFALTLARERNRIRRKSDTARKSSFLCRFGSGLWIVVVGLVGAAVVGMAKWPSQATSELVARSEPLVASTSEEVQVIPLKMGVTLPSIRELTVSKSTQSDFTSGLQPPGNDDEELVRTVVANQMLAGMVLYIPEATLPQAEALVSAKLSDLEDRAISQEALLGMLRHLRHEGVVPEDLELVFSPGTFSQEDAWTLWGMPDAERTEHRVEISGAGHSETRRGSSPVEVVRTRANAGMLRVVVRRTPIAPDRGGLDLLWWKYGDVELGFHADSKLFVALRLDPESFLAAHQTVDSMVLEPGDFESSSWNAESAIWALAISPADGRQAAVALGDSTIRLMDLGNMEEIARFEGHRAEVLCLAFAPDGARLVTGSQDRTIRLWDVGTGELLRSIQAHAGAVSSVAVSPDGRKALSGGADGLVILWNLDDGAEERWLFGHEEGVTSVAFSPSGDRAITGANDGTARLWDLASGDQIRRFEGHGAGVQCVAFSPDGSRVLTGVGGPRILANGTLESSYDRTIRIWDAETGEELRRLVGHRDWVTCAAFSPDGRRIVSGSGGTLVDGKPKMPGFENDVRVWDLESGLELYEFPSQEDIVRSVTFTPDGEELVVGGWDGILHVATLPGVEESRGL